MKKSTVRKISCNIPSDILAKACAITNLNQTEALVEGLKELIAQNKRQELLAIRGKVKFNFNVEKSRQRVRL